LTKVAQCLPRSSDPSDQELAARLNAWSEDTSGDFQKSLAPALIELGCWVCVAILLAGATVVWLV